MKKLAFILMVMTLMIVPTVAEAQNPISRPSERDIVLLSLINNMLYVEGGTFMMGSDDREAYNDEKPLHRESVQSFSIGKYEVTRKEWRLIRRYI